MKDPGNIPDSKPAWILEFRGCMHYAWNCPYSLNLLSEYREQNIFYTKHETCINLNYISKRVLLPCIINNVYGLDTGSRIDFFINAITGLKNPNRIVYKSIGIERGLVL